MNKVFNPSSILGGTVIALQTLKKQPGFRMARTLSFLLLFLSMLHGTPSGEQYLVSYRGVVQEHRLFAEEFRVSRSMLEREEAVPDFSFTLENDGSPSVPAFFKNNQDAITQRLFREGVMLSDRQNTSSYDTKSKTVLYLPPTLVTVTVKEDLVTIGLIK